MTLRDEIAKYLIDDSRGTEPEDHRDEADAILALIRERLTSDAAAVKGEQAFHAATYDPNVEGHDEAFRIGITAALDAITTEPQP